MFRQNQSARLDAPPEILRQTFKKETYNITESDAIAGDNRDVLVLSLLLPTDALPYCRQRCERPSLKFRLHLGR